MLRFTPSLVLVLGLLALTPLTWAQSSDNARSVLAGISFTDPPIQLPVTESFEDAMLNVATDLQRRCMTIEAYGWRLRQAEQKRVNDIFDSTALQLGSNRYKLVPRTPRSASPEVTVFTADKSDKSLLFLWSAGELGLVLLICDTEATATSAVKLKADTKPSTITKTIPKDAEAAPEDTQKQPKADTPTKPKEAAKPAAKSDDKSTNSKTESKSKAAKTDAKKLDPAKADSKKSEAKKPTSAKAEVKKSQPKKAETKKPEPAKPSAKKETTKSQPKPVETSEPKNISPEVREMLESLPDMAPPAPQQESVLPIPQEPETPDMAPATPSEAARQNSLMPPPITTAPGVVLSPDIVPPDGKATTKQAPKPPAPKPAIEKQIPEAETKLDVLPPVPAVESLPEPPTEMPMPPAPPQ